MEREGSKQPGPILSLVYATSLLQHQAQFALNPALVNSHSNYDSIHTTYIYTVCAHFQGWFQSQGSNMYQRKHHPPKKNQNHNNKYRLNSFLSQVSFGVINILYGLVSRGVKMAGALAPSMLKPRGREYLFVTEIFSHIFACRSLNFHSLSLCCLHTIKTHHTQLVLQAEYYKTN